MDYTQTLGIALLVLYLCYIWGKQRVARAVQRRLEAEQEAKELTIARGIMRARLAEEKAKAELEDQ